MHLIIEGRGGDWHKLQDLAALAQLLDDLPDQIAMTKITAPVVLRYVGSVPQDWGLSGFVMIAESHIAVHTFPQRGEVSIDVFSCKAFDTARVVQLFVEAFGLAEVETCVLRRGLEYGREIKMLPATTNQRISAKSEAESREVGAR